MKVTRLGRPRPVMSATSLGGSGGSFDGGGNPPSGHIPTATGSNTWAWGSNVAIITANGSNALQGPFVNFASGTGITFAVASNTLTISGGGSVGDFLTADDGGGDILSTIAASGAAETIDLANGNVHDITLTDDCTFTFTGAAAGRARSFTLVLRQGASPPHLATWPGSVVWPSGSAPTLQTALNAVDVLTFFTLDGGTVWFGFSTGGGGSSVGELDDLTDVEAPTPSDGDRLRHDGTDWRNSNLHWEPMVDYDGLVMLDSAGGLHMHEVSH
jgi:hypothetical protein